MTSSGETSPLSITPAGTPLSNQAPKYGTLIPNRIFVGGIAANQNEQELKQFFSAYGAVKDCKIIADRAGVSKGYGFVTFETQEDAEKIIKKEADNLIFKDRKLNIGPAIRKQQAFPKLYEQNMTPGAVFFSNGVPYTYQNGMAVFQPSDSGYSALSAQQTQAAAAAAYPMMMQSAAGQPATAAMYALSQHSAAGYPQTAYSSPTAAAAAAAGWGAQWRWTPQSPPVVSGSQYMYPMQSPTGFSHEMLYASQGQYPSDMAAAAAADSSMLEAAQAAEGSVAMDPNMAQQPPYAEVMAPPQQQPVQQQQQQQQQQQEENNNNTTTSSSSSSSTSSINHGKRHAAPMVVTPRKHLTHPFSSTMYSARATPPPAKVFHGHSPLTPPPTPEVQHQGNAAPPNMA